MNILNNYRYDIWHFWTDFTYNSWVRKFPNLRSIHLIDTFFIQNMVIKFSCTLSLFSLKNMSLFKKKLFGSYHQRQVNEMHLYRLTFLTLLLKYKRKKNPTTAEKMGLWEELRAACIKHHLIEMRKLPFPITLYITCMRVSYSTTFSMWRNRLFQMRNHCHWK